MKLPGFFPSFSELCFLRSRCVETSLEINILLLDELEQVTPQALPTPTIVGEQHGHDFFRQVFQGVNGSIAIRHVWGKNGDLFPSEVIAHSQARSFMVAL
jgi:hypothetical protein